MAELGPLAELEADAAGDEIFDFLVWLKAEGVNIDEAQRRLKRVTNAVAVSVEAAAREVIERRKT